MNLVFGSIPATLVMSLAMLAVPPGMRAQELSIEAKSAGAASLPEAPLPQIAAVDAMDGRDGFLEGLRESSSQAQAPQTEPDQGKPKTAEDQLKEQEKQRVMGVMATFNTTSNRDALPLSPGQKFRLFFKSSTDPWPFMLAGVVSGIGQAKGSYPEWGQGARGYAKRFGAAYTDTFIGNFFGNAVLPVILREDPRYFQKGTGSKMSRFLWAASSTVWCRRDNGKWGPNYSNLVGNLIGSGIARAYYPESERDVSDTITDGLTVSAEGIVGAEVIEFWPDMVRRHRRKQAEKLARQQGQQNVTSSEQSAVPAKP